MRLLLFLLVRSLHLPLISEFEKSHYPDVYSRDRLAALICVPEPRVQVCPITHKTLQARLGKFRKHTDVRHEKKQMVRLRELAPMQLYITQYQKKRVLAILSLRHVGLVLQPEGQVEAPGEDQGRHLRFCRNNRQPSSHNLILNRRESESPSNLITLLLSFPRRMEPLSRPPLPHAGMGALLTPKMAPRKKT